MEYTTHSLSRLAGVSTRTLRYYDEIGLLKPIRTSSNGYRIYGQQEVDRLQQILFYKAMGMELDTIRQLLESPRFDPVAAMEAHLQTLLTRQEQLSSQIAYVNRTIAYWKGEIPMSDPEKFDFCKDQLIQENDRRYGKEAREKYGQEAVDFANAQIKGATKEQLQQIQALTEQLKDALRQAVATGDPAGDAAQAACRLHQQWIRFFWKTYTPQAHLGLCQMYLQDPRFYEYYESIAPKCADFLLQAMKRYLNL